jgi:hypothetical protein
VIGEIIDFAALGLALFLFWSSVSLIRPANGERPLLVGFMVSSMFGLYIASIRIFSLQHWTRETFGAVLCIWLLCKLWALYATALHTRHPLLFSLRRLARFIFGHNPSR